MSDRNEILGELVAITGADEASALNLLEATNWSLNDAINLYLAHQDDAVPAAGGNRGSHANHEEAVRAPLPSKFETLYGATSDPHMLAATSAAQYGLNQQKRHEPALDVFRNFKAEGEAAQGASSGAGLSELFKPPQDLVFLGNFEMAKQQASQEGKWLLLNIQANNEFDTHRLNRDTWTHDSLKELIKGMFLFCQQEKSSPEGQKLASMYKAHKLPATLVVDPMTGASLYSKSGFIGAEKLIEDLVPFMDHGPTDPGAGQMAHSMNLKRKAQEEAAAAARPAAAAGISEDDELALAIAMSMADGLRQGGPGEGSSRQQLGELDDINEAEVWEQIRQQQEREKQQQEQQERGQQVASSKTPEEVQQEAQQRLPPEPPESSTSACRVAIRLPDGQRMQRRFELSDTVQALKDLCMTRLEEAAGGRPFDLVPQQPGAQLLSDPGQTLEAAGVANAMLLVRWQ